MRIRCSVLAAAVACLALPAAAQVGWRSPGLHYFHRVGATLQQHDDAVRLCAGEAAKMLPTYLGFGPIGSPNKGLLGNALQSNADRSQAQANIETCMVVRGWTVMRPPAPDERGATQVSQATLIAWLEKRVGAANPPGTVVRRYDPTAPIVYKLSTFPPLDSETLSFRAVFGPPGSKIKLPDYTAPNPEWRFPRKSDPTNLATGATTIVVRTHGTRPGQQINVRFMNVEDLPTGQPALTIFQTPSPTKMFWKAGTPMESLFVFEVPPGLWVLMGDNASTFCLRAPVFEVRPGEAVFAGTFSSEIVGDMQPKMDMAPAKVRLPAAMAERLRPAEWRNGISFDCGLVPATYLNALEVRGAPPA